MTGDIQAVLTALDNAPALLVSLIRDVPEPFRKRRPAPERWSAHEHFCHVVSLEPRFRVRLERMLTEDDPELDPIYPSAEEEAGALLSLDLEEAIAGFIHERGALANLLRELPPEAWDRRGKHPEYAAYTVFVLVRHMAVHDMLHGYRIEDALRRRDWPEEVHTEASPEPEHPAHPAVEEGIPGSLAWMKPGEVNLLGPFTVPGLAPRRIRVYLPRDYDRAEPRFGLYMFDGQNAFDDAPSFSGGWHLHEAVEGLARSRRPVPVVIGIDHGGADRNLELSPFPFEAEPGRLEILLDWITGRLMPALAAELNLVPGPLGAFIGGSSMGGLAAFWTHFRHPEAFGGAMVMSPSFWVANQAIFEDIAARPTPEISRLYLDGGMKEDKGRVVEAVKTMVEHLVERGYDSDRLMWRSDPKGTHSEASWRRRLPKALRFLYPRD